ncbi:MAG: hypothetical protein K6G29_07620 [Clostridiales bacterium]|jgi:hypothetical protein|nr:hypothetical protein [Clostridia bacterium]MCR5682301.1 hypothetical protein [Clostridiales bacterium]
MAIVKRADRQHYMNTGTAQDPVWSRIGEGFTEFAESKNAVSYQRRYIHEYTKRTDVTGYAPVIDYEFEVYTANPVIERLRRIADAELVGEDAKVDILTVDLFDEGSIPGQYRAYRRQYSVIPDESGRGTDALVYTGTMKGVGDIEEGTFVPSSGVWTGHGQSQMLQ